MSGQEEPLNAVSVNNFKSLGSKKLISRQKGLAKAEYAVGYFTEMGIGCRRDPLEANVWYVKAADQGEERAKHRLAAIRAAAAGDVLPTSGLGKGKMKKGAVAGALGG